MRANQQGRSGAKYVNPGTCAKNDIPSGIVTDTLPSPNWFRIAILLHPLFEAHFLPAQMIIIVITSMLYVRLTDSNTSDPHNVAWVFVLCSTLRTLGFLEIALYLFLYEDFHALCVEAREKEMREAGLVGAMSFSRRKWKRNWVDYFVAPVVAPLFGSVPAVQAQVLHFWRTELRYEVSRKVVRSERSGEDVV